MKKGFWVVIGNMSNFAKSFLVVYALGFLFIPSLLSAGYDHMLIVSFSISLMLLWSDGFLTLYALSRGATEINPLMNVLNKKIGKKGGFLVSRVVGSILPVVGLLIRNIYFVLLLAWLLSGVVCLSSVELAEHSNKSPDVKNANTRKD